jgi:Putative transmembrane protein (PGPGW)
LLLSVLPGPFTIPLVILGLVVLGLEFAWAQRTLERVKEQGAKLNPKKFFKK